MFGWFRKKKLNFQVKLGGVDANTLHRFKGRRGYFYACTMGVGSDPDDGGYFYGDAKHQFFFYGGTFIENNKVVMKISRADTNYRLGGEVSVGKDKYIIEENIRKIFLEKDTGNFNMQAPNYDRMFVVEFLWSI